MGGREGGRPRGREEGGEGEGGCLTPPRGRLGGREGEGGGPPSLPRPPENNRFPFLNKILDLVRKPKSAENEKGALTGLDLLFECCIANIISTVVVKPKLLRFLVWGAKLVPALDLVSNTAPILGPTIVAHGR